MRTQINPMGCCFQFVQDANRLISRPALISKSFSAVYGHIYIYYIIFQFSPGSDVGVFCLFF